MNVVSVVRKIPIAQRSASAQRKCSAQQYPVLTTRCKSASGCQAQSAVNQLLLSAVPQSPQLPCQSPRWSVSSAGVCYSETRQRARDLSRSKLGSTALRVEKQAEPEKTALQILEAASKRAVDFQKQLQEVGRMLEDFMQTEKGNPVKQLVMLRNQYLEAKSSAQAFNLLADEREGEIQRFVSLEVDLRAKIAAQSAQISVLERQLTEEMEHIRELQTYADAMQELQTERGRSLALRKEVEVLRLEQKQFEGRLEKAVEQAEENFKKQAKLYEPSYVNQLIRNLGAEKTRTSQLQDQLQDKDVEIERLLRKNQDAQRAYLRYGLDIKTQKDQIQYLEGLLESYKLRQDVSTQQIQTQQVMIGNLRARVVALSIQCKEYVQQQPQAKIEVMAKCIVTKEQVERLISSFETNMALARTQNCRLVAKLCAVKQTQLTWLSERLLDAESALRKQRDMK